MFGRVARDAPTTTSPITDMFNLAEETFEAFHRSFLNIAGAKDDAEFWAKSKTNFETFQNTLTTTAKDLNEQVNLNEATGREKHVCVQNLTNDFLLFRIDQTIANSNSRLD